MKDLIDALWNMEAWKAALIICILASIITDQIFKR